MVSFVLVPTILMEHGYTFLEGTQWKKFWYKSGENSAVTIMHVIGTRRPMEKCGSIATSLDADDLYIDSGSVSALSCDASGTA